MKLRLIINNCARINVSVDDALTGYAFKLMVIKSMRRRNINVDSTEFGMFEGGHEILADDFALFGRIDPSQPLNVRCIPVKRLRFEQFCGFIIE